MPRSSSTPMSRAVSEVITTRVIRREGSAVVVIHSPLSVFRATPRLPRNHFAHARHVSLSASHRLQHLFLLLFFFGSVPINHVPRISDFAVLTNRGYYHTRLTWWLWVGEVVVTPVRIPTSLSEFYQASGEATVEQRLVLFIYYKSLL